MNKINWINGQAGGTPLSAENLNLMQDNIEHAIEEVEGKINTYTKTIDANGWTVLDFGAYKEYVKKCNLEVTIYGNSWDMETFSNLPEGMSTLGDNILTTSHRAEDSAVSSNIFCGANVGSILVSCQNHYSGTVTTTIHANLKILEII